MTISKEAMLGMIEINSSSDTLVIVTTSSTITLVPSRNTYANIIDFVSELKDQMAVHGSIYLTEDFKVIIEVDIGTITSITAGTIKTILGSDATIVNYTATFDNIPLYSWIPRYRSSDGTWWAQEAGSIVKGSLGVSGNLSGISYTTRQTKSFQWPFVLRKNAFYGSGDTDELRSFESVINGACSNYLTQSDSGNIYCKGLYYIHSIDDYTGSTGALSDDWGDGSPNGETYVFCSCMPASPGGQSEQTLNTYYDVSHTFTTSTAPSWDN